LGLEDEHCLQIAGGLKAEEMQLTELPSELATLLETMPSDNLAKAKEASLEFINEEKTSFKVLRLSLNGNSAITNAGYKAIFPFFDEMKIQGLEWVSVHDHAWDAKINLVMKMNWYLDRRDYMTKDVFQNRRKCFNFLHRINTVGDYDGIQLDSLYFTLRENPEFIAATLELMNGSSIGPPFKMMRLS
jgi:DNA-directed RNA polymerase subunit L